jgi:hypothetical protein
MTAANKFHMPFLLEADASARIIWRGIRRRCPVVAFPFPTAALARASRLVPICLYDRILGGRKR